MLAAELASQGTAISYESPSLGAVSFGWDDPFIVDGDEISLDGYERLDTLLHHRIRYASVRATMRERVSNDRFRGHVTTAPSPTLLLRI